MILCQLDGGCCLLHTAVTSLRALPSAHTLSAPCASPQRKPKTQVVLDLGRRPEARFQGLPAEYLRDTPVSSGRREGRTRVVVLAGQLLRCQVELQSSCVGHEAGCVHASSQMRPDPAVHTHLPSDNSRILPTGVTRGAGCCCLQCWRVWQRQQGWHPRHPSPHQCTAQPQWSSGGPHLPRGPGRVWSCCHGQGHTGR